jgi:streptogramin lyase
VIGPIRRLVPLVVVLVALCLGIAPSVVRAALPLVVHLPQGTEAEALAVGPEGELWFAGVRRGADAANVSGRIAGDGSVEEFPVPESGSEPGVGDLTLGPDGNMWFTEPAAGRIDFESPDGGRPGILVLPDPNSRPTGLATVGNSIWTTLEATGALLVTYPKTATGAEYGVPESEPSLLSLGGDGSLWIIDGGGSELLRKPPAGRSISFPIPDIAKGADLTDIVTGPEGNLWLSQSDGPYVARFQPESPRYTRFELPFEGGGGFSLISNGPRHDIWFAGGGFIGSITSNGHWFGAPTCALGSCATLTALAEGPEGGLWFAAGGTVARFEPPRLSAGPSGRLLAKGRSTATTRLACSGGAAGQHCQGKLEMRSAKGPGRSLGSVRFGILTGNTRKVTINLTRAVAAELARDGRLAVRLVARTDGKVSATHIAVLRAAE